MHLVYKALEKYAIPSVLPPELMPLGKRKDMTIPISKSPATVGMTAAPPPIPPLPNVPTVKSMSGADAAKVFTFRACIRVKSVNVIFVN